MHCHAELGKRGDVASLCVFGALFRVRVSQSTLDCVAGEAAAFHSLWLLLFSLYPFFIGRFVLLPNLYFPIFLNRSSLCSELLHRGSFLASRTTYLCSPWFRARACTGQVCVVCMGWRKCDSIDSSVYACLIFCFVCAWCLPSPPLFFHFARGPFFSLFFIFCLIQQSPC